MKLEELSPEFRNVVQGEVDKAIDYAIALNNPDPRTTAEPVPLKLTNHFMKVLASVTLAELRKAQKTSSQRLPEALTGNDNDALEETIDIVRVCVEASPKIIVINSMDI